MNLNVPKKPRNNKYIHIWLPFESADRMVSEIAKTERLHHADSNGSLLLYIIRCIRHRLTELCGVAL